MKTKTILIAGLIVVVAASLAGIANVRRQAAHITAPEQVSRPSAPAVSGSTLPTETFAVETKPETQQPKAGVSAKANPQKILAQAVLPAQAKEPIQDPTARVALSFVGADPDAEAYWIGAINNPGLSAHERQDLIEDLNEDGLSDPRHPGPQDWPLIVSRIRLIEELAPYAVDQVNWDAFMEAYKDLLNLEQLAMGGGTPVN